ncbi:DUF418 domain-containing protein [Spirillospora sp. NPDC000708]
MESISTGLGIGYTRRCSIGASFRYFHFYFLGLGICGMTAGALDAWQWSSGVSEYSVLAAGAGVATAVSYVIAVVLVMRTRIRRVAFKIALVGRMGLANYLGASVLIVVINRYVQLEAVPAYGKVFAVGCCVFLIEAAFSWIWLHYARYDPLEWIWRTLTWEKLIPNRRLSIVGPTSENIG